ncbi:hypothetical protein C8R44DRAFT_741213 [Mycena epipterygia]|nr:hypothetical protein C8R44DRAFT_741213 [Mycena epipterygia]
MEDSGQRANSLNRRFQRILGQTDASNPAGLGKHVDGAREQNNSKSVFAHTKIRVNNKKANKRVAVEERVYAWRKKSECMCKRREIHDGTAARVLILQRNTDWEPAQKRIGRNATPLSADLGAQSKPSLPGAVRASVHLRSAAASGLLRKGTEIGAMDASGKRNTALPYLIRTRNRPETRRRRAGQVALPHRSPQFSRTQISGSLRGSEYKCLNVMDKYEYLGLTRRKNAKSKSYLPSLQAIISVFPAGTNLHYTTVWGARYPLSPDAKPGVRQHAPASRAKPEGGSEVRDFSGRQRLGEGIGINKRVEPCSTTHRIKWQRLEPCATTHRIKWKRLGEGIGNHIVRRAINKPSGALLANPPNKMEANGSGLVRVSATMSSVGQ